MYDSGAREQGEGGDGDGFIRGTVEKGKKCKGKGRDGKRRGICQQESLLNMLIEDERQGIYLG